MIVFVNYANNEHYLDNTDYQWTNEEVTQMQCVERAHGAETGMCIVKLESGKTWEHFKVALAKAISANTAR